MLCLAATVVILKSILKSSDLKTTLIAFARTWRKAIDGRGAIWCFERGP